MVSGDVLIPRLEVLYGRIDTVYRSVAEGAGFACTGCDGTRCCTVDVTLHTLVEMLFLRRGFNTLEMSRQREILRRCRAIVTAKEEDPYGDAYRNAVCALNFDGACSLYAYRPMICRLAGIRHLILRPDGTSVESVGCVRYEQEVLGSLHGSDRIPPHFKLDRSRFYRIMAEIEIEVVRAAGRRTPSRTVAEVLGLECIEECFS